MVISLLASAAAFAASAAAFAASAAAFSAAPAGVVGVETALAVRLLVVVVDVGACPGALEVLTVRAVAPCDTWVWLPLISPVKTYVFWFRIFCLPSFRNTWTCGCNPHTCHCCVFPTRDDEGRNVARCCFIPCPCCCGMAPYTAHSILPCGDVRFLAFFVLCLIVLRHKITVGVRI